MMRRVLIVSPHFPPDTSAATHRVRLLAPHLPQFGWEPTIVTVDPRDSETRLDPDLAAMVPESLRVVRARGWSHNWTRRLGFGDLGLRAFRGLQRTSRQMLRSENFDLLFITIYPSYPALLGPRFKREFGVPFVLDYQDPWVGEWGRSVGGGTMGEATLKNRLARWLATKLEPPVARAADAITAVSAGTYEAVLARNPELHGKLCAAIPLGGEAADYEFLRTHPRPNAFFDPDDGHCHVCYVGTLLPLGFETLRAVLKAAAVLRLRRPELYARLRFHFFGTSNQTATNAPARVLPVARDLGVANIVSEVPYRVDYLDALTLQTQASAILMMGSSERHYTASKLYPGLLARRPILAAYHEASTAVDVLGRAARPPTVRLVTYGDTVRAEARVPELARELEALVENPIWDESSVNIDAVKEFSAQALAGLLAQVFDRVVVMHKCSRSDAIRPARPDNAPAE
jgi:hypothetical protein